MVKHEPELHTNVVGPVEGPTEPQLITVELERSRKQLLIRGNSWSG